MSTLPTIGLLTAFGAGLISFLSPCVAPLLPGYVTMLSGSASRSRGRMQLFWSSLLFVAGFSLVFVSLGASVSVFGDALARYRDVMARVSGGVMLLMGLVILWGARLPVLMRERRFHVSRRSFTASETLLIGMAFGFGWTPCFGPILASILAYTSTAETVREGTLLLAAYSFGLGLPFLAVGLGLGQLQRAIRGLARHGQAVAVVSGVALVAIGLLFLSGQMYRFSVASQQWLGVWTGGTFG